MYLTDTVSMDERIPSYEPVRPAMLTPLNDLPPNGCNMTSLGTNDNLQELNF